MRGWGTHSWYGLKIRARWLRAAAGCALITHAAAAAAVGTCTEESAVARLAMVQGEVRITGQTAEPDAWLCPGHELTTGAGSRASFRFTTTNAVFHVDQTTTLHLRAPGPTPKVGLLRGAINALFRRPGALEVETPIVNASIKGTEYLVRVDEATAVSTVAVFEGVVAVAGLGAGTAAGLTPVTGSIDVARGQRVVAEPGDDLAAANIEVAVARDELAWSLYYPPVLDAAADANTRRAVELLRVGRIDAAAPLLIEAVAAGDADALAVQATIAVVQNDKALALQHAEAALAAAPDSAAAHVAMSYARQARFEIAEALAIIEQCAARETCAPRGPLFAARLAELELANGNLARALAQCPEEPVAGLALACGFAELANGKSARAQVLLTRAVTDMPTHPLARLGLGLTRIRQDDIAGGRADIELAAALDPLQSVIRSYLGKAYYEERRCTTATPEQGCSLFDNGAFDLALQQFDLARELDPNDPTPDLYSAIAKQANNRPVEALKDLQASIRKNDNRAVYRSSLLLDQDEAARSAGLARVYRNIGFDQLALAEGYRSIATDPANFAAHRFLADTYSSLPRHEIARVSEYLQAQLRQPINASPGATLLGEVDIPILDGAGPSSISYNEFNAAFLRNGVSGKLSSVIGTQGTFGHDVSVTTVADRLSINLSNFSYDTDGARDNQDLDAKIYSIFAQAALSSRTTLIAEARHADKNRGDIATYFLDSVRQPSLRQNDDIDMYRIGGRHVLSPRAELIGHYTVRQDVFTLGQSIAFPIPDAELLLDFKTKQQSDTVEFQHFWKPLRSVTTLVGGTSLHIDGSALFSQTLVFPPIIQTNVDAPVQSDINHDGIYVYSYVSPVDAVTFTLGAGLERFKSGLQDVSPVNPKLGVVWRLSNRTTLRAAGFRTLNRTLLSTQTIEPTQVAGFNQFYDDTEATKAWRYGGAIDHQINDSVYVGTEGSARDLTYKIPGINSQSVVLSESQNELFIRGYAYWAATETLSFRADLDYEKQTRDLQCVALTDFTDIDTRRARIGFSYHHPAGVTLSASSAMVKQGGEFTLDAQDCNDPASTAVTTVKKNSFVVFDLEASYRLPNSKGRVALVGRNLFDQRFRFQDTDPRSPRISQEKSILLNISLFFL